MKNRIIEFLRIENKTSAQFAEEIGVQPSGISHIISGRNNPSLDFVIKMLSKYPQVSSDWLLFGKGNMFREGSVSDLFQTGNLDKTIDFSELTDTSPEIEKTPSDSASDAVKSDISHIEKGALGYSQVGSPSRIICFFDNNTFQEYIKAGK
jgi:transcriptional regulator with XRE-family HTH domain